jgi:geranylgeranyl reductase family protein
VTSRSSTSSGTGWDVLVVGAGPAGAATAIGALRADPTLRVALLDRAQFPRDKSCGDGVAPHVIDLLEDAGVTGLVDDLVPVHRLRISRGGVLVDGRMRRPAWVVPRATFDHRLAEAARAAGAELVRHRVRDLDGRTVDGRHSGRVVVGADGAHSVVRRSLGLAPGPMAVAIRGYAPTPPGRRGTQVIQFGHGRQPAYAWSFDRGDGLANVGYGELLTGERPRPTRAHLLRQLESLLPGATDGATQWVGHQLPLSTARTPTRRGPVLLAGDAAGLVNPMTGEGIYYAVATGLAAGRAAAEALRAGAPESAGARHARATRALIGVNLKHTAAAAWLCRHDRLLDAGIRAAAGDELVFDDLVELGLANGRITRKLARAIGRELVRAPVDRTEAHPHDIDPHDTEERPACES